MLNKFIFLLTGVAISGCASITSDSTQLVRVDAMDEEGLAVEDAQCDLTNDKGVYSSDAGKHALVRKSANNLNIVCTAESRDDKAEGTAISRAGAGMFGNIIFGGAVGAVIDHSRGTAYNYPEWMQVMFGQTLIFDRTKHESGVPMEGEAADESERQTEVQQTASE